MVMSEVRAQCRGKVRHFCLLLLLLCSVRAVSVQFLKWYWMFYVPIRWLFVCIGCMCLCVQLFVCCCEDLWPFSHTGCLESVTESQFVHPRLFGSGHKASMSIELLTIKEESGNIDHENLEGCRFIDVGNSLPSPWSGFVLWRLVILCQSFTKWPVCEFKVKGMLTWLHKTARGQSIYLLI